jgi:hypothetical protein
MAAMAASPFVSSAQQSDTLRALRSLPMSRLRLTFVVTKHSYVLFAGAYWGACLLLLLKLGAAFEPAVPLLPSVFLLLMGTCIFAQAGLAGALPVVCLPCCLAVFSSCFFALQIVGTSEAGVEIRGREAALWGTISLPMGIALIVGAYCCLYWALGSNAAYARK